MTETVLPQPSEIPYKEKEKAMAAYLMMFATAALGLPFPLLNLVASLIYYYFIKESSRFVKFHSLQSLLSQIPISILNGILVIWTVRIFLKLGEFNDIYWGYLIALVVFNIIYIVFSLIAAFKGFYGRMYYFMFFGRIAYREAFEKSFDVKKPSVVNKPPN
ncbi:MAG: DUF4870 domain-containing protein [Candidatus Cyclobacteriaceae bacterium M2_1C_046]